MGATAQSWQGIAPCAQVAGLSAALAGQLALLLDTLTRYWQQSAERRTPAAWQQWLQQLLTDFFLPQSQQEQSLFGQLQQALTDWLLQCQQAGLETALELAVVAEGWLEPFAGQGLTQRFLAGAVNFATLMPMRAIPFAQIHLLGMNDGDFPRQMARLDFDLMQQQYRPGDRSRRDDDEISLSGSFCYQPGSGGGSAGLATVCMITVNVRLLCWWGNCAIIWRRCGACASQPRLVLRRCCKAKRCWRH